MVTTAGSPAAAETEALDVDRDRLEEAETADRDPVRDPLPAAPRTGETETVTNADLTIAVTQGEMWTAATTETADTAGIATKVEADAATARHRSARVATDAEHPPSRPNASAEAATSSLKSTCQARTMLPVVRTPSTKTTGNLLR